MQQPITCSWIHGYTSIFYFIFIFLIYFSCEEQEGKLAEDLKTGKFEKSGKVHMPDCTYHDHGKELDPNIKNQ